MEIDARPRGLLTEVGQVPCSGGCSCWEFLQFEESI